MILTYPELAFHSTARAVNISALMKHLSLTVVAACLVVASASAQQLLPSTKIGGMDNWKLSLNTIGEHQSGKTNISPKLIQILDHGSTGDGSALDITPDSTVAIRALRRRLNDTGISVLDYGASVGTGGDDSAAINAAISQAINVGIGLVLFPLPPSGAYNVCADAIRIATDALPVSLTLRGLNPGGVPIRALSGCNSPAVLTSTVFVETGYTPLPKSKNKLVIEGLRIDGNCISRFPLNVSFSIGLTMRNTVVRNARPGSKGKVGADMTANVRVAGGYENDLDRTVLIENLNEKGQSCYTNATALPDYGLWNSGTDSKFNPVVISVQLSGIYQDKGGNNDYSGSHVWGYSQGNLDGQPDLRPQYGYILDGRFKALGAVADSASVSGFWLRNTINDSGGSILAGSQLVGPIPAGATGIKIDGEVRNTIVAFNNLTSVPNSPTSAFDFGSGLHGSNIVTRNMGSSVESNLTISSVPSGDSLSLYSNALGAGANIETTSPTGSSNLRIMGQGSGAVILGTRGLPAFSIYSDPNAANFIQAHSVGSNGWPELLAVGLDANIPLWLRAKGNAGVLDTAFRRKGDPSASDIPSGSCADWNNTSTGSMKRFCNIEGKMRSIIYK